MCAVLMLVLYSCLLHILSLSVSLTHIHTHTHTQSSIDQCLCFSLSRGFTFNGQAVNTQHAQLVNPVRSTSVAIHTTGK